MASARLEKVQIYMGVQILGGQVFDAVLVFTYVLAFVVLSVATVGITLYEYFGFAIGMYATIGGFAIGKVWGGSLNPAVSIGIFTSHIIGGGASGLASSTQLQTYSLHMRSACRQWS